jgi:hypothetical protein
MVLVLRRDYECIEPMLAMGYVTSDQLANVVHL